MLPGTSNPCFEERWRDTERPVEILDEGLRMLEYLAHVASKNSPDDLATFPTRLGLSCPERGVVRYVPDIKTIDVLAERL